MTYGEFLVLSYLIVIGFGLTGLSSWYLLAVSFIAVRFIILKKLLSASRDVFSFKSPFLLGLECKDRLSVMREVSVLNPCVISVWVVIPDMDWLTKKR